MCITGPENSTAHLGPNWGRDEREREHACAWGSALYGGQE